MKQEMKNMLKRDDDVEKKNKYRSVFITANIVTGLVIVFLFFWDAVAGYIPPLEEKQYVTTGRIDFGTSRKGRGNKNNLRKPSKRPADKPKTTPKKTEPTKTKPTPKKTNPFKQITNEKAETEVPTPEKGPENNKPVDNTPKPTPSKNTSPSKTPNTTPATNPGNDEDGGSAHGDDDEDGNRGNPNTRVLDPSGMFEFGEGIGGSSGRAPIELPLPEYDVNKEAKIKFTFVIAPDGSVRYVKRPVTMYPELAKLGREAIKRWRFTEVDAGAGNLETSVTITFRLK